MPEKHLAIEVDLGAVRFVKLDGSFVVDEFLCRIEDQQDYRIKKQLSEFIEVNKIKEQDFNSCSVSWMGERSTLIPNSVFAESSPKDIMRLCFGTDIDEHEIDYNRISELGVVNTYLIPLWVKNFFVINFPRVEIQHAGTHLLRGLFDRKLRQLTTCVSISENSFRIVSSENNDIAFYSTFQYTTVEDILYYFSFTLQQKEWLEMQQTLFLEACAGVDLDLSELKTSLQRIVQNASIEEESNRHALNQLLCV